MLSCRDISRRMKFPIGRSQRPSIVSLRRGQQRQRDSSLVSCGSRASCASCASRSRLVSRFAFDSDPVPATRAGPLSRAGAGSRAWSESDRRSGNRSGLLAIVRDSACCFRHAAIAAWSAGSKHFRHRKAPVNRRPSIVRTFEKGAPPKRFCLDRLRISEHPGQQPDEPLDHDHRRHLAPGQHVVPDRDLLVDRQLENPLVDPLVASADQEQGRLPGQGLEASLGQRRSLRREIDDPGLAIGPLGPRERFDRRHQRLRRHHHSGPATVGRVVDGAMAVGRPVAQVVGRDREPRPGDGRGRRRRSRGRDRRARERW